MLLKQRVSEARRARVPPGNRGGKGLAEACQDAAGGDPWLALLLAVEAMRVMKSGDKVRLSHRNVRSVRKRPTKDKLSFEELMQSA